MIKTPFFPSVPEPHAALSRLERWRQTMLDRVLLLGMICVFPLSLFDILTSWQQDRQAWAIFAAALVCLFLPIALLRGRSYHLRGGLFLLLVFGLMLITLLNVGLIGAGRLYAIITVFSATLLLAPRHAAIVALLSAAAALLILGAQALGWQQVPPATIARATEPATILLNLGLLLLTIAMLTFIIRSLIADMTRSLDQVTTALAERDRLNDHLETLVAARTADLAEQLRFAEALERCSQLLFGGSEGALGFQGRMQAALETVRAVVDADRVLLVHGPAADSPLDLLVGAASADLPDLRPPSDAEWADLLAIRHELHAHRPLNGAVSVALAAYPHYQRYLTDNGVRSLLLQPLTIGGTLWGYLQVFDYRSRRSWHTAAMRVLHTTAEIILAAHAARQASQALHEREGLLRTISDTLPEGFLFQVIQRADGTYERCTYVSRGVESLFGVTPDQVLRDPTLLWNTLLPEDQEWVTAADLQSLRDFQMFDVEARYRKADGRVGWFHIRSMPQMRLPEGRVLWNGISLEMTLRKEAELALATSQNRLRALGDNLPGGFIYQYRHDSQRNPVFTYLSSGVERVWGVSSAAGLADVNAIYRTIIPEDLGRIYAAELRSRDEMRTFAEELRHRMPNGEIRWALMSAQPRREPDGSVLWDGVTIDITERKQAAEALQRAKETAETADRAKSDFLAHMSHEIRTPLNAVIGMAELLAVSRIDEQQRHYLNTITTAGHSLLAVINQILDFSRIESGQLRLDPQPFDLQACMRDAIDLVAHDARRKGLDLSVHLSDHLPLMVLGDRMRIGQVILNILANAVKFTENGGVRLFAHGLPLSDGQVLLKLLVQDSGVGMSTDAQARIFKPFVQADGSTARRYGGTGLGLAICRQLVALMGGSIQVESAPGVGSTFTVMLPLTLLAATTTPEQPEAHPPAVNAALRVLIAEDNPVNQQVARELLLRLGHSATIVPDGLAALEEVSRDAYDVVLMDVQMPRMDGEEATRRIRDQGRTIHQPYIVALTASALSGDRERLLALGMDAYLSKPVHLYDLQQALARVTPAAVPPVPLPLLAPAPIADDDLIDRVLLEQFFQAIGEPDGERVSFTVELFMREVPPQIATVEAALQADDRAQLRSAAHRLRGGCLQLGARRLALICHELEQQALEADAAELTALLARLRESFADTLQALQQMA